VYAESLDGRVPSGATAQLARALRVTGDRDAFVAFEGRIVGPFYQNRGNGADRAGPETSFSLAVERRLGVDGSAAGAGVVQVRCHGSLPPGIEGRTARVIGRARPASGGSICIVTRPGALHLADDAPLPCVPRAAADLTRAAVLDRLQRRFEGAELGLAAALTAGTYAFLPQEVLDSHMNTGAVAFLAVSGLNVTFIVVPALWLLRKCRASPRSLTAVIAIVIFYIWLAGGAAPVVRAGWAASLAALAPRLGRRAGAPALLAAGATFEILTSPDSARAASFQLSYGAVLGFACFYRKIHARMGVHAAPPWARAGIDALLLGFVAFLSTAGITAAQFGQIAWSSLLIGVPLTMLFPPLFFSAWLSVAPGWIGDGAAALFSLAARAELAIVNFGDSLPGSPGYAGADRPLAIGLAALAILLIASGAKWRGLVPGAAALVALLPAGRQPGNSLRCILHPVGHGLAASAALPGGTFLQIDCGSLDDVRAGRRTVVPGLLRLGASELAVCTVSHSDSDHANGYPDLLERFRTRAWTASRGNPWNARLALASGIPRMEIARLDSGAATAEWLEVGGDDAKDNDREIVTILRYAGRTILFPGDLEKEGVRRLLQMRPRLRCDVLVMPHHGLDNDQVEPLVDAVRPALALASCGRRFRLDRTRAILAERGIPLFTTREQGLLHLEIRGNGSVVLRRGFPVGEDELRETDQGDRR
jgi:competence protein ComEC